MNGMQIRRLVVALAVVVAAWGVLALVRRPPSDRVISLTLPVVDTAAVDSVLVTKGGDTVHVVRRDTHWDANGYPADSGAIHSFLTAVKDTSTATELVAESAASQARLGVSGDSATHLRAFGRSGAVLDLLAGDRTSDYSGVYVRRPSDDAVYALHGALVDVLTRDMGGWRDKRIAQVSADSVGSIDVQRGKRAYTLHRVGARWHFASGAPADSSAVASMLDEYRDLNATGFANRSHAATLDFARPSARVRLLSMGAKPLVTLLLDSTATGTYARVDTGGVVYTLDGWTWGKLAPPESALVAKTPAVARTKPGITKR